MSAARHYYAVVLATGVVSLPARAWLDQDLVRRLFDHAGAELPPTADEDQWMDLVFSLFDAAEEVTG